MNIKRREFIRAGGMLAIVGAGSRAVAAEGAAEEKGTVPAADGAAPAKLGGVSEEVGCDSPCE